MRFNTVLHIINNTTTSLTLITTFIYILLPIINIWQLSYTKRLPLPTTILRIILLLYFNWFCYSYSFLVLITLIIKFTGLPWGVRMNSGYKFLTAVLVFHLVNCYGEHFGWLPEPKVNTFVLGLDKRLEHNITPMSWSTNHDICQLTKLT